MQDERKILYAKYNGCGSVTYWDSEREFNEQGSNSVLTNAIERQELICSPHTYGINNCADRVFLP